MWAWLACFFFVALLGSGFNAFETPDSHVLQAFVDTGRFSLESPPPQGPFIRGIDGRYYSAHEIATDLVAVPAAFIARHLPAPASLPFARRLDLLLMFLAAGFSATTIVVLGRVAVDLGVPFKEGVTALVLLTLGSQYLVYAGSPPDVSLAAPILAVCLWMWM